MWRGNCRIRYKVLLVYDFESLKGGRMGEGVYSLDGRVFEMKDTLVGNRSV